MAESESTFSQAVGGTAELVHLRPEVRAFLSTAESGEALTADAILVAVALAGDAYRHGAARVTIRWQLIKAGVRVEVDGKGAAWPNGRRPGPRIVRSPLPQKTRATHEPDPARPSPLRVPGHAEVIGR